MNLATLETWLKGLDAGKEENQARWRAELDRTLKRSDAYEHLTTQSLDGIDIKPLYDAFISGSAPAQAPKELQATDIAKTFFRQLIDDPEPGRRKRALQADIEGGATHFLMCHESAINSLASGLKRMEKADLSFLLDRLDHDHISIRLDAGTQGFGWCRDIADYFYQKKRSPRRWLFSPALSPTTIHLLRGTAVTDDELKRTFSRFETLADQNYTAGFFAADSRLYHASGASEVEELALLLAEMAERLREAERQKLDIGAVFSCTLALMSVDNDLWLNVAKLRAARRLIRRFSEACGLDITACPRLEADISPRMFSRIGLMNNLLRATLATAASHMASIDGLSLIPHSAVLGTPDLDARRLIRNLALIARDEAGLNHVFDPLAGSGAIETLTETLCQKAWALFQTIEADGGLSAWIKSGQLVSRLEATRQKRLQHIATSKTAITSVSIFPDTGRDDEARMIEPSFSSDEDETKPDIAPVLHLHRLSEPFECLRSRTEALPSDRGIFIVPLDEGHETSRRTQSVKNRLEIACLTPRLVTLDTFDKALQDAPPQLVILSGHDAAYNQKAEMITAKMTRQVKIQVWGAGEPDQATKKCLQALGIQQFIGVNGEHLIERLNDVLDILSGTTPFTGKTS